MELDKMDENDWKYHGEGNKSLVVSHLSRVLRLLKYPAEDSENPPQMLLFSLQEVVKLPLEFVRQLSIKVQHQRPAWRCDKVMDIYSGCALCLPNLTSPALHQPTHTPPLCIEIKPKCGFLPSPKHVSKDIKTKVCRYCMHQHYKVANGKWKRRSFYCPLDLFSGNRQRMHFAIKHLIEEPQNNFKVFKGGQCIYSSKEGSDDSPDMTSLLHHLRPYFLYANNRINSHMTSKAVLNDFIQVLVNALLSGGGGVGGVVTDRRVEERSFCEASIFNKERIRHGSRGLPSDSVLFRILQTQMLDTLDIEGLYPLYRRVEQHLQDFPKERTRLQIEGPYNEAFLEKLQKCPAEDDGSVEYAVAKVHQYRVAMTAKDCSLMVALVPSGEEEQEDNEGPPAFSYSVSILDLDPKPFDSVSRQLRLDQKIVSCYLRTGGALPKGSVRDREDCTLLFHPM
uniref:Inositol-pentakisphosphate 2-kinase n=1 Tax=Amphilophus citrinellus TaxID=61819 RepID=A0A3Q0RSH3_AMPCI